MGYGTLPLGFHSRCISLSVCFSLTGSSWQEISLHCRALPTLRLAVFGLRGFRQLGASVRALPSTPVGWTLRACEPGFCPAAAAAAKMRACFWRNACRTLKEIRCNASRHTSLQPKHLRSFHLHTHLTCTHAHTSRCGISEAVNKSDKRPPFQSTSALPRKYRGTPRLLSHSHAWGGGGGGWGEAD